MCGKQRKLKVKRTHNLLQLDLVDCSEQWIDLHLTKICSNCRDWCFHYLLMVLLPPSLLAFYLFPFCTMGVGFHPWYIWHYLQWNCRILIRKYNDRLETAQEGVLWTISVDRKLGQGERSLLLLCVPGKSHSHVGSGRGQWGDGTTDFVHRNSALLIQDIYPQMFF